MEMSQKKPVFQEVAGSLSTRIRRRELAPGMALPSENELCRQFSISRFSVRKALDILEADGLIFRQPGVGSFVSESRRPQKEQKTLNIAITGSSSGFNPYIAEVFDGAQKICSGENARLVYCPTEEFIARNGGDMDGLILMTTRETPDDFRRLNAISGNGIPVVLINRFSDLPNLAYATVDYELESRRAVELLFRMGRKRVGLIQTASLNSYANQTRTAGYREACRQAGRPELICTVDCGGVSAISTLEDFLRKERPDALFVTMQRLLDYVLLAGRTAGRGIGQDLAVMCFDKVDLSLPGQEEVMYIDMPLAEMAASAAHFIIARRRGEEVPMMRTLSNVRFVFSSNTL